MSTRYPDGWYSANWCTCCNLMLSILVSNLADRFFILHYITIMPMNCGIFDHPLLDGCLVTNPAHIEFIRKSVKDFRHRAKICRRCKNSVEYMFEKKMCSAKSKNDLKKKIMSRSLYPSVSSNMSSNINLSTSSEISQIIVRAPLHLSNTSQNEQEVSSNSPETAYLDEGTNDARKQHDQTKNPTFASSVSSSDVSSISTIILSSDISQPPVPAPLQIRHSPISATLYDDESPAAFAGSEVRLSQEPSTSRAAASNNKSGQAETANDGASRKRRRPEDDEEPLYSLNAFNGTRMPNVQPIVKRRRPFHHPNPIVMEIYAKGLLGG